MKEVFICDAVRTPVGRYAGALAPVRPDDLLAHVIRVVLERNEGLPPQAVDEVFAGCANQAGEDNRNVARMALLLAGLPVEVPGATINRLCGSGLDAVAIGTRTIRCEEAELVIAGGVESMSRSPFVVSKADKAYGRSVQMYDTTIGWRFPNPAMKSQYGVESMPETGENVATDFQVSRADQDAFALRSQKRHAAAKARGFFQQEIVPVEVPRRKADPLVVSEDEHPRPDSSLEVLAKLRPLFPDGTITAGNASGVNDGACALILASEAAAKRYGLTPRARVVGAATAGVPPRVMGIGPARATKKLLTRLDMDIGRMDTIELNEAFASQSLATLRELGVPDDAEHVNPNGGAIAIGHPLGMSGARLATTALYQLLGTGGRYGLCTMCIGVGQGIALVMERV